MYVSFMEQATYLEEKVKIIFHNCLINSIIFAQNWLLLLLLGN